MYLKMMITIEDIMVIRVSTYLIHFNEIEINRIGCWTCRREDYGLSRW